MFCDIFLLLVDDAQRSDASRAEASDDSRMTERYSHLSEWALVEAIQALPVLPTMSWNGNDSEPSSVRGGLGEYSCFG